MNETTLSLKTLHTWDLFGSNSSLCIRLYNKASKVLLYFFLLFWVHIYLHLMVLKIKMFSVLICFCLFWQATLLEKIGLKRFDELFSMLMKLDYTLPISDENVTVMDITFSDIPVRLYLPKRKSASQRPAVIFVHGGAFVLGSCSKCFLYKQIWMSMCVCVYCTLHVFILEYIVVYI